MYAFLLTRVHGLDLQVSFVSVSDHSRASKHPQGLELSYFWNFSNYGGRNCEDHQFRLRLLSIRGNKWSARSA